MSVDFISSSCRILFRLHFFISFLNPNFFLRSNVHDFHLFIRASFENSHNVTQFAIYNVAYLHQATKRDGFYLLFYPFS